MFRPGFRFVINEFKEKNEQGMQPLKSVSPRINIYENNISSLKKENKIHTPQHCTRHLTVPQKTVLALLTTFTCRQVSLTPAIYSC